MSPRELMMPCTFLCWMVGTNTLAHTHTQNDSAATQLHCNFLLLPPTNVQNSPKLLFCSSPFPGSGFDGNIDSQGELILQESFQVWDPKTLIRKGRDRHLFLFEMSLVFSKEVKDSNGRSKYLYKSKLFVSIVLLLYQCLSPLRS